MIIVFYGQPQSGKTTLAYKLQESLFLYGQTTPPIIDGDEIREIFKNKDFSREGRIKNLNRISDIATYLHSKYKVVIISAVYPIKEAREYLDSICDNVLWVYLKYNEIRGREEYHVKDFDMPNGVNNRNLYLNTSIFSIEDCINEVFRAISL
jgi:adenylylsulfate kinase-like enzyme